MRHPKLAELFSKRLAVKKAAAACGISPAAVSRWEVVPANRAAAVAKALDVDVSCLPIAGETSEAERV